MPECQFRIGWRVFQRYWSGALDDLTVFDLFFQKVTGCSAPGECRYLGCIQTAFPSRGQGWSWASLQLLQLQTCAPHFWTWYIMIHHDTIIPWHDDWWHRSWSWFIHVHSRMSHVWHKKRLISCESQRVASCAFFAFRDMTLDSWTLLDHGDCFTSEPGRTSLYESWTLCPWELQAFESIWIFY